LYLLLAGLTQLAQVLALVLSYRGQVNPQNLAFNANLQEFAQQVGYITALETSGKLTPVEAYNEIKELWEQLKSSKKSLNISDDSL
jgi:hypothetical protein